MANKLSASACKRGMGGSNCGAGRSEKTADMKRWGRKMRREIAKREAREYRA